MTPITSSFPAKRVGCLETLICLQLKSEMTTWVLHTENWRLTRFGNSITFLMTFNSLGENSVKTLLLGLSALSLISFGGFAIAQQAPAHTQLVADSAATAAPSDTSAASDTDTGSDADSSASSDDDSSTDGDTND
jgi:hypothetical protein